MRRPHTAAKTPDTIATTKQMSIALNRAATWGMAAFSAPRIAANTKKTVSIPNIKATKPNTADKTA